MARVIIIISRISKEKTSKQIWLAELIPSYTMKVSLIPLSLPIFWRQAHATESDSFISSVWTKWVNMTRIWTKPTTSPKTTTPTPSVSREHPWTTQQICTQQFHGNTPEVHNRYVPNSFTAIAPKNATDMYPTVSREHPRSTQQICTQQFHGNTPEVRNRYVPNSFTASSPKYATDMYQTCVQFHDNSLEVHNRYVPNSFTGTPPKYATQQTPKERNRYIPNGFMATTLKVRNKFILG